MKSLTDIFLGFLYWLNKLTQNTGFSIIIFTILVKLILLPLDWYAFNQEKKLNKISKKMKEIMQQFKKEPEKQLLMIAELYKEVNYNPFVYFLAQIIQIPIFLAFFFMLNNLVKEIKEINFLGIDLVKPSLYLALITILLQFLLIQKSSQTQKKIAYIFLGLIALIVLSFPAIFTLYWATNLVLTILERQVFLIYEKKFVTNSIQKEKTDIS